MLKINKPKLTAEFVIIAVVIFFVHDCACVTHDIWDSTSRR